MQSHWQNLPLLSPIPLPDDATAGEKDTLGAASNYGNRGMGVCADLGSHRWCRALSTQHNTEKSKEQQQQSQSLEIPEQRASKCRGDIDRTTTTTIPASKTLTASPAKTAAFTVKTTRRRRSRRRAEGSSICVPIRRGQGSTPTPTIQVLQFVLVSLLALLAKNAQAHNIPGECNAIELLNKIARKPRLFVAKNFIWKFDGRRRSYCSFHQLRGEKCACVELDFYLVFTARRSGKFNGAQ